MSIKQIDNQNATKDNAYKLHTNKHIDSRKPTIASIMKNGTYKYKNAHKQAEFSKKRE